MRSARRSYLLKTSEPMVMVPARIAALLERGANISALRTRMAELNDAEASAVLDDIRIAALHWSSSGVVVTAETEADADRQPARGSEWLNCSEVAEGLGISRQAVGKAIREGRLEAMKQSGSYRISRDTYDHYRARRTG